MGDGRDLVARVYGEHDARLEPVRNRRIAILGYGSQGRAHALNLQDSGCEVRVGLRSASPSWERAEADGLAVQTLESATAWADLITLLVPDQVQGGVFEDVIGPHLAPGSVLMLAAAYSVHFGYLRPGPDIDVALVAPVGPGPVMRELFQNGQGVPGLFAVWQDVSGGAESLALSYARALGCTRAGVLRTTFREETETDLFGEQAVLCGGLSGLVKAGYDTLVDAGYQPEIAYFECVHQIRLIADLLQRGGLTYMYRAISDTAEFGAYVSGPRVVDDQVRSSMRGVLADIQNGSFARRWHEEFEAGLPMVERERDHERRLEMERVGKEVRRMMGDTE